MAENRNAAEPIGFAAIKFATLAVIGTLRPTEQRRAFIV